MDLQTYFETPEGENTVVIRMKGMGKGLIWVNGKGVGRYWISFLSPLAEPTQLEYHIPRSFMNEKKKNMLVILEEEPGVKLEAIDFVLVNRDTICSYVGEDYPVSVKSWKREGAQIVSRIKDMRLKATMKCPSEKQIVAVEFASFGDPTGTCGNFTMGKCSAPKSKEVVEKNCLGKNRCSIVVERETFGDKGCPKIVNTLAVQVKCEKKEGKEDEKNNEEEEDKDDEDIKEEEEEEEKEEEDKDVKNDEKQKQDL